MDETDWPVLGSRQSNWHSSHLRPALPLPRLFRLVLDHKVLESDLANLGLAATAVGSVNQDSAAAMVVMEALVNQVLAMVDFNNHQEVATTTLQEILTPLATTRASAPATTMDSRPVIHGNQVVATNKTVVVSVILACIEFFS